jgi:hypothetical protein
MMMIVVVVMIVMGEVRRMKRMGLMRMTVFLIIERMFRYRRGRSR